MSQDWQTEKIKELFKHLKKADERIAPPFAILIANARAALPANKKQPTCGWQAYRLAAALFLLLLLGGSLVIFFRQSSRLPKLHDIAREQRPITNIAPLEQHPQAALPRDIAAPEALLKAGD